MNEDNGRNPIRDGLDKNFSRVHLCGIRKAYSDDLPCDDFVGPREGEEYEIFLLSIQKVLHVRKDVFGFGDGGAFP